MTVNWYCLLAVSDPVSGRPEPERSLDDLPLWRATDWAIDAIESLLVRLAGLGTQGPPRDAQYGPDAYEDVSRYRAWVETRLERGIDPNPLATSRPRSRRRRRPARGRRMAGRDAQASPRFSVVVYGADAESFLCRRSVAALDHQSYGNVEILVTRAGRPRDLDVTASTGANPPYELDDLNRAALDATGDWIAFVAAGDVLSPATFAVLADTLSEHPYADLVYTDEDTIDVRGLRRGPVLKPDWSPDLLHSCAYLGGLIGFERGLLRDLKGVRTDHLHAEWYDLMLRATEKAHDIVHIPMVAYHRLDAPSLGWFTNEPAGHEAGRRALASALERKGESAEVGDGPLAGTYHVRRSIRVEPHVNIIIPFKDQPEMLRTCVDSVRASPGYQNYELILVDNGSEDPETLTLLERFEGDDGVGVLSRPGPFNWAVINNFAVAKSSGDLLLFLNNDIEARQPDWLAALVEHGQRPEVGVVGGRLVYPDGTLQHCGIVLGLGVIAGHVMAHLPSRRSGYLGFAALTRNWSAVTGACLMSRRSVFESFEGFDESLHVAFNDIDYCLRVLDAGLRVVTTPLAELVHHESITRGLTGYYNDYTAFLERWESRVRADDPFFHRYLSRLDSRCVIRSPDEDAQWNANLSQLAKSFAN